MTVDELVDRPRTTGALRPASFTASREQARQEQRAGRSGVLGLFVDLPQRFRHLGSPEAADSGLRYQPVAWTVIAICAIAFFFPGRPSSIGSIADFVAAPTPVTAPVAAAPSPPTTAPVAVAAPSIQRAPLPAPAVSSAGAAPQPAPAPTVAPVAPVAPSPPPTSDSREPLRVTGYGWAGTTGASPVGVGSVPEGTMPVANRLGSTDKVSFLRLAGDDTVLTLTEDTDAAQEMLGPATVRLCVVEDGSWEETAGQRLDEAPGWTDTCAAGTESDGTWSFDVSGLGDPSSPSGFALVPGTDAPADFQVAFLPA